MLAISYGESCAESSIATLAGVEDTVEPFLNGLAPSKLVELATVVWEGTAAILRSKMNLYGKEYKIVVTGHGIGGGIAALVSMLAGDREPKLVKDFKLHTWMFGSPPVSP